MKRLITAITVCILACLMTGNANAALFEATYAERDATYGSSNGFHALHLPGLPGGSNFRFNDDGLLSVSADQTTATLTGTVTSTTDANSIWQVLMTFVNGRDHGDFYQAGVHEPKLELKGSAYGAGPVDPTSWWFYQLDAGNSTLTGIGAYSDTLLLTTRPTNEKYVFQVGVGANGKNVNYGMSGWFGYDGATYDGTGDVNINLTGIAPPPSLVPATPEPTTAGLSLIGLASLAMGLKRRRA